MGKEGDEMAALDAECRVKGREGCGREFFSVLATSTSAE